MFPDTFLLLIAYLILFFDSVHTLYDFSHFYVFRFDIWPRIWPILVNIQCASGKNAHSVVLG